MTYQFFYSTQNIVVQMWQYHVTTFGVKHIILGNGGAKLDRDTEIDYIRFGSHSRL